MRRIACFVTFALVASAAPATAAGNLLPNPGFESSVFEPAPVPEGTLLQPILPTGWVFEGSAGLFDHTPNYSNSGERSVAISIPASGKRQVCGPEIRCNDNIALNAAKSALAPAYSINPHWRTALPVPVSGGGAYTISAFMKLAIVTEGEGAISFVRWFDANGLPLGTSSGPELRATAFQSSTGWIQRSSTVYAPGGAASAHVGFGHSDDVWIGQVLFDDVSFG